MEVHSKITEKVNVITCRIKKSVHKDQLFHLGKFLSDAHKQLSYSVCHVPKIFDRYQSYNDSNIFTLISVAYHILKISSVYTSRINKCCADIEQYITEYKNRLNNLKKIKSHMSQV